MIRLKLATWLCPSTHRIIEVEDVSQGLCMAQSDLIGGGDALARGWDCDPSILYNGAEALRIARKNMTEGG